MGASTDTFVKYPRTAHLFGSRGTDDDRHLDERQSLSFLADESLIVEEKLDGTNVGVHFLKEGRMVLQARGHEIGEGEHSQYDLFKQWVCVKRAALEAMLGDRYIMYGEWLYAKHSIHYRALPHYFFEFDIYDKVEQAFLDLDSRLILLDSTGIATVPVIHRGPATREQLWAMIGRSRFDSVFENPESGRTDDLMEGLYLRTETDGVVTGRAKIVRPAFVEKIKQSEHWMNQAVTPNVLVEGADLWA